MLLISSFLSEYLGIHFVSKFDSYVTLKNMEFSFFVEKVNRYIFLDNLWSVFLVKYECNLCVELDLFLSEICV